MGSHEGDVVVIDAVRTPMGRRNGSLAGFHSADLFGIALRSVVDRSGIEPVEVDQVIGGCISQVGQQAFNVTRTAWLTAGLPETTAATTLDSQCGSSQQAVTLGYAMLSAGLADVVVAGGVEVMSRVPLGSGLSLNVGKAIPKSYYALIRIYDSVRGRGAYRREVGNFPRRGGSVRFRFTSSCCDGLGRGPI